MSTIDSLLHNWLFQLIVCSLIGAMAIGVGIWMSEEIHTFGIIIPTVIAILVFRWIRYRFPLHGQSQQPQADTDDRRQTHD